MLGANYRDILENSTIPYVSCILHQSQISAPCNFSVITVITITVFYVRVYTPGHKLG